MADLVTIVLPTYNGEKYIKQMLDSIEKQDYRPIEIIVSDDCSKDNTVGIIEKWINDINDKQISVKLLKNTQNLGLSGNVSRATKYIQGKYLFMADQDDLWKPYKISEQVDYLENNLDCQVCICDRSIINSQNKVVCKSLFKYLHASLQKRDYKMVMNRAIQYSANCMCLRTEHLHNIFPIPKQICEHDTFIAIMAAHYGKIGYLNKALTLYRIHDNNLSKQYALETNRNVLKAAVIIKNGFDKKNKRERIDPPILKAELKKRFNEEVPKWSGNLYSGKIDNVYVGTIEYIFLNKNKWKIFL